MAHILARHSNETQKEDVIRYVKGDEKGNLFYPNNGRVMDPEDSQMVADSKNGDLIVSFPWVDSINHATESLLPIGVHPVTGSNH